MKRNILHLHFERTAGKSLVGTILRTKKFKYIQASKFFNGNVLESTNRKEKIDKILHFLESKKTIDKPLFISGHIQLDPYFYSNNYKIFTVFRDPFKRFKSQLSFMFDNEKEFEDVKDLIGNFYNILNYPMKSFLKLNQSNLSQYAKESILLFLCNGQCRQIADISFEEKISDIDLLNITLERLEYIDFISSVDNLKINFYKFK